MYSSDYLHNLQPGKFKQTLKRCVAEIRKHYPSCNLIFGRGLSGAMIIPALAAELKISFAIIRKRGQTHGKPVEFFQFGSPKKYKAVFVDDCIDTGKTVNTCKKRLKECVPDQITFVGGVLYG
jgi:orotate phosphoribosyltransferase